MNETVRALGQGLEFPPGLDADGRWAWSSAAENIRQSIRIILSTEPGERLMLPEFGGGLKRHLFRPNVASTHRLIQEAIVVALGRWERRIRLESVDVVPDPDDPRAWRGSAELGGSPGAADPEPEHGGVVINEVLTSGEVGAGSIELHNLTSSLVDVGNWVIGNARADDSIPVAYALPDGAEIPARGYLVIEESELPFPLDVRGGELFLGATDGAPLHVGADELIGRYAPVPTLGPLEGRIFKMVRQ